MPEPYSDCPGRGRFHDGYCADVSRSASFNRFWLSDIWPSVEVRRQRRGDLRQAPSRGWQGLFSTPFRLRPVRPGPAGPEQARQGLLLSKATAGPKFFQPPSPAFLPDLPSPYRPSCASAVMRRISVSISCGFAWQGDATTLASSAATISHATSPCRSARIFLSLRSAFLRACYRHPIGRQQGESGKRPLSSGVSVVRWLWRQRRRELYQHCHLHSCSRVFRCSNQLQSFCCWSFFRSACRPGATGLANPGEIGRLQTAPALACCRCHPSILKQ